MLLILELDIMDVDGMEKVCEMEKLIGNWSN